MSKAKDVASKGNSSSKQIKHKSAKNKGVSSLKNVSSQNANNASGRIGVAAVALASTLSMLLPGATALAKTSFNADSFDSSYVNSVAKASGKGAGNGKGKGDGNDLYKNGLLNTGTTSERAMRQMVGSVKEYLVKNADSNADSNASAEGVNNQEAVAGNSSVGVKNSGERSDAGSETGNGASFETGSETATDSATEAATKGEQDNSDVAKPKNKAVEKEQPAEVKPAAAPASKTEPAKSEPANTDSAKTEPAKTEVVNPATESKTEPANSEPAAKTDSETKTNSSAKTEADQKSAQPASTENAKPENAQTAQSASTQNTQPESAQNTQPVAKNGKEKTEPATENTDSENTAPAAEQSTSTESAQPTAKAKNDSTTTRVRNRRDTNQNAQNPNNGGSVTPADNAPETPSASAPSAGTESSAGVGATENTDSKEPVAEKPVAKEQGTEGNANGAVADRSGEGANVSNNDSNANSQVIKPNEKNPEASDQNTANSQVQTDKKPEVTYNLKIRYTIGGAANKQLVQPYELTIDKKFFDDLGKEENYQYIKLPKSAGYNPAVYHSGNYQYYIEKKGKFVIDDGMNADADRYLRIDKNLIKEYAVKKRQAVGGNNSDQTSQNPSSTQSGSDDGIQYYGELNINYAPKTAKYYVRHLVQEAGKDEFKEYKDVPGAKTITVGSEEIHVTEATGTVGSNVSAVAVYIPGYEPEHNLISSPLSDSEDESDKLILNLRYYRKAYEVTYDSVGGTDVTAQKVYYQQLVQPVKDPTRRGYTFKGWHIVDPAESTENTKKVNFDASSPMPNHDVKLRAVWEANKTTSYRVNVWVQKADLVDKEHPNSLANYDFVGLVERKNVKTDSDVALNNMDDAGVANDTSRLNGASEGNYVENPELGLTREELQGTDSEHKTGLIAKFNWMNDTDTAVTDLDGYDTEHPGAATNKGKDLFTRYFHVNKDLTKKLNSEEHYFVPGRPDLGKRIKSKLCADDLNNTLNLVYDRKEYELIFAKPAVLKSSEDAESLNNAAIKREDKDGKTTIYCYAGGGNCSEKYDGNNEDDDGNTINHKGYRVNVRYGQSLTDIWPDVNELDFGEEGKGSLGWRIGYAGDVEYRDTPPYRFTKKEFADPKFRVVGNKHKLKISDNPDSDPNNTYELKDNQRLITADTSNKDVMPIQVIIEKQSIASAKSGNNPGEDDYVLSTDSYSKDDTESMEYDHKSSSIAGFNSVEKTGRIGKYDSDDFDDNKLLPDLYSHSIEYENDDEKKDWDELKPDEQEAFKKKYNVGFRKHLAGGGEDSYEYEENGYLVFKYKRQPYDVQFYNADGNAITKGSDAAKEKLPYEYSLTKRGKKDLTGEDLTSEDKELYGKDTSYDASVTKDNADDTSKQFDGKYTFTLNGTKYSIIRPDYLPKDYVFKGWAVDQAGTRFINGEDEDITVPVNGIKLYAAWGLPEGVMHTVTLDYNMNQIGNDGKEKPDTDVKETRKVKRYDSLDETTISIPTRKGYDFYGWELVKKGDQVVAANTPYAFGNKVVEDITLKAVWIEDTRYNGTFKHVFLKPGVTFKQYNDAKKTNMEAALVDHVSTQTVSGLREHLRYNAEAVYSDETHFPDKHFTSFEASSNEKKNTGEFVYQTYNTRKYKVKYIDQNGNELLPESEVSSVNQKYDVAFYKPIAGFKPRELQQNIEYTTDDDGKQTSDKEITFTYDDIRVLKRKDESQARPTNYTRYVFKVDNKQSSMGSVVDWQGSKVADGSALVYDAIKGTKAYQMPLPTVQANPGFKFAGWTSTNGANRLPIRSEEQNSPEVIYTANFELIAPVAAAPQVLTPTEKISTASSDDAKKLITNVSDYPTGATFSFAPGATFDSTPGLHKIKVQVKLEGNIAEAEVLYRVLPDLVYASDWDKFKTSDYGKDHISKYAPITFTSKNDEGTIIGHDTLGTTPSTGGTTTLTAYVYKGKDVRIRVPQAFGKDHSENNYHFVFKGWATKVVEPTTENPNPEQKYDIDSEGRYKDVNVKVGDNSGKTYHAVYKKIDYFSSSSDGGEVPKDAVVAIFKPAPGRLWKDGTSGPKVFYVKKGTDISKIPYSSSDPTNALVRLKENLTNATGTWKRSSMLNDGKTVTEVKDVADVTGDWKDGWKVNESFQEFVAYQELLATPEVESNTLLAIRGDKTTLPEPKDYIANYSLFDGDNKNPNVESVTVEYASSTAPTVDKAGVYTVPLIVSVKYKDVEKPVPYKTVGKLKVMHDLIYGENVKDLGNKPTEDDQSEHDKIASEYKKVNFITNESYGTMASGSRTLFYAHTGKTSGVKAPQAIGKDYDADGYHYEFVGWKKLASFTKDNSSAETLTIDKVNQNEILQSSSILKNAYDTDTTYQAVYKRVENVIDASQQDEIPDGYVATIFLPGFGRTWADGSYKPKLLYIRHGKDKEDNIKFAKKVASDTAATLSGFTKWQMYNARGDKSNILLHDNWDISKPRIFVAEQNGVDGVKIPETVIGVGESIPNVNKLVHNTDPKVSVSIDSSSTVDVLKPGISTIMVNVTKPIDETDSSGKQKTVTTKLPVRVYVLPNVIADNDLPAKGTAAAKFIEKNYTKVTYVAGDGGSLQKSPLENAGDKPVSVYWVRNDANGFLMQVPDVLANKGYVFKNWTSITTETPAVPADKRKATEEEREALARLAKIDGMHYVAKLISDSRNSTLAALQNLLNEAQKQHAAQVYNAKREELAKIAESKGKIDLASNIRKSNDSLQNIKNNMLIKEGIDVDEIVEHNREKALLAKIAKEAGNETLAEEISKSNDSLTELRKKLENAGIDLAEYNKLTFDKKKEALAQFADINGLHYVASIIRASHKSSLEAFKNLIKSAKPDVKIPAYKVNEEDYASEEQRELLMQIAEEKERPDIAAKIRLLHSSTLQDLKKLFADAGVDLYTVPAANPKKEITITANFELMKPMRFEFRSSVISGIPATFTLTNLTENSSGNTTVSVDDVNSLINALTTDSRGSNGLLPYCTGTTCKISGTPKIVDGKPKVELTFTTVDQYGRRAEIVVYIDIVDSAKPEPTPEPEPELTPEPDYSTVPSDYVVPAPKPMPAPAPAEPLQDEQETSVEAYALPQTGVDSSQSALIASLLASVGFAGFAAKHRRKREDGKDN